MSQRSEKYARNMDRRVSALEEQMQYIDAKANNQGLRLSYVEDDLAVYKAAVTAREAKKQREAITAERQARKRPGRHLDCKRRSLHGVQAGVVVLAVLGAVLCMIIVARAVVVDTVDATSAAAVKSPAPSPITILAPTADLWDGEGEDPQEAEKIEEALLASGYFSIAVPMCYDYQDFMRTYCEAYTCPYPLALAVAEVESNFDMDAVGVVGEIGIMQLNPGPGGTYHAELEAATGLDPTTPSGNIAAGCYLLGKYMAAYEDPHKAAMAYNMGLAGAKDAWAAGITSTDYSTAVVEAMERWEVTVNAWRGI